MKTQDSNHNLYLEAYAARLSGNFDKSLRLIKKVIKNDPKNELYISELFSNPVSENTIQVLWAALERIDSSNKAIPIRTDSTALSTLDINPVVFDQVLADFDKSGWDKEQNFGAWSGRISNDFSGDSIIDKKISMALIDDLIGSVGMQIPNLKAAFEHLKFIEHIDHLDSFTIYALDKMQSNEILHTDLGSLIDFAITKPAFEFYESQNKKMRVVEVGGGYGRTAEFLLQCQNQTIQQYFLVDSVPSSVALSFEYLSRRFPEKKIQLVFHGDKIHNESQIVILPAWNLSKVAMQEFELFINIESFQEMTPEFVQHWINFADNSLSKFGWAYISNSRCYKNKGDWPIPLGWNTHLHLDTPRSWTIDHPSALFQKSELDSYKPKIKLKNMNKAWRLESQNFTLNQINKFIS